jgi:hypothetical protein
MKHQGSHILPNDIMSTSSLAKSTCSITPNSGIRRAEINRTNDNTITMIDYLSNFETNTSNSHSPITPPTADHNPSQIP